MPNQQLRDYIAAQLRLGVTKEAIRATLVGSGWAEADINVSMSEATAGPSAASPLPRETPSPAAANDALQTKREPMFDPRAVGQKEEERPAVRGISRRQILFGAVAVAVLALVGGAGAILWGRVELQREVEALTLRVSEFTEKVAALTKEKEELNAQMAVVTSDNQDLELQLSIFAVPQSEATSTAGRVPVLVRGTLTFSTSTGQYTVVTNRNVRAIIENSKDQRVDATLWPLIGTAVEISGTHLPGDRTIRVTHVGDRPVQ